MQLFSNNATATLAAAITNAATALTVVTGKGALFASPAGGDYELATITDGTAIEIVKITARSADAFTVVRAQEGTAARAWSAGVTIEGRATKGTFERFAQDDGTGTDAIALGGATAPGIEDTIMGKSASGGEGQNVALGGWAAATAAYATALGWGASALKNNSVALGKEAFSDRSESISVGVAARCGNDGAWQASTYYAAGSVVTDSAIGYLCITAGTSGSSSPAWNSTEGATTSDVSVTWRSFGSSTVSMNALVAVGYLAKAIGDSAIAIGLNTVSGQNSIAMGESAQAANTCIAFGYEAVAHGGYACTAIGQFVKNSAAYYSIVIGSDITNSVDNTHVIGGPSLVVKSANGGSGSIELDYCGQENYIFSDVIDLKTAADAVAQVTMQAGTAFFVNEVGIIVTSSSGVTGQPNVSFGIVGNTVALLASTATTKSSAKGRDTFTPLSKDGVTSLTASVKVGATATAMSGRFYWKGILVQDE